MDVTLTANDAAATTYTLVDASSPWKLVVWDWGNAIWDQQWSGARGTLGARPSHSSVQNRPVAIGLRLLPASKAALPGHLADLGHVVEQMRRYGGLIAVTTDAVTYTQYLAVLSGSAALQPWTNRAEWAGRVDYALTFMCEPYVRGASMEVIDTFSSDTTGDYTYDDGAATDVAVSSGELTPVNPATAITAIHTAVGYAYGDVRVSVTSMPGSTLTNYKSGVVLKRTADGTHLEVYVDDDGANSRLRIDKVVAGARTNLATTTTTRISVGQRHRVVGYVNGNTVTAEFYLDPAAAEFSRITTNEVSTVLTSTDVTAFGHDATGQCGWVWTAQQAAARLDDFQVSPFAYIRTSNQSSGSILMRGDVPGDAPALGEIEVMARIQSFVAPEHSVIAFPRTVRSRNFLSDGSFDTATSGTTPRPWVVSAVSGVTGAATSISNAQFGRFGRACAQIVCPATANTGASAAIYGPFYAGVTYTADVYCKAASATTNTRVRLGVSGDISSSTPVALSTTWTLKTVTWTPTATVLVAYIACEVTAATATTWQIDGAQVYEGTTAPTRESQTRGRGGRPPAAFLAPDEAHTLTGFAVTASSDFTEPTGAVLRVSSGTTATAKWRLDPTLADPSPHTGQVEMEVWAMIDAPDTTWTTPRAIVSLQGGSVGQATYTREYGSTGVAGAGGLVRLGTLAIPQQTGAQLDLVVTYTCAAISGQLDIGWVALVPPSRRVIANADPGLMPTPVSGERCTAQIQADGLVRVRTVSEPGWSASPGVGQTITIDPGQCELIYGMYGSSSSTEPRLDLIRVTPTPRWHHMRDV